MKGNQLKQDTITFNVLIVSYGRKQTFEKMEQVFQSLLRSKENPTLRTFNSMILNYGKSRLREKAEAVFKKMNKLGIKPSIITYESSISMYGLSDCVSRGRERFDEIVETRKEVQVSTLKVMLDAYCINGLLIDADRLLNDASEKGIVTNALTYKLLCKAYTKANEKQQFLDKLLKRMDEEDIVLNKIILLEALGAFSSSCTISESNKARNSSSTTRILATILLHT